MEADAIKTFTSHSPLGLHDTFQSCPYRMYSASCLTFFLGNESRLSTFFAFFHISSHFSFLTLNLSRWTSGPWNHPFQWFQCHDSHLSLNHWCPYRSLSLKPSFWDRNCDDHHWATAKMKGGGAARWSKHVCYTILPASAIVFWTLPVTIGWVPSSPKNRPRPKCSFCGVCPEHEGFTILLGSPSFDLSKEESFRCKKMINSLEEGRQLFKSLSCNNTFAATFRQRDYESSGIWQQMWRSGLEDWNNCWKNPSRQRNILRPCLNRSFASLPKSASLSVCASTPALASLVGTLTPKVFLTLPTESENCRSKHVTCPLRREPTKGWMTIYVLGTNMKWAKSLLCAFAWPWASSLDLLWEVLQPLPSTQVTCEPSVSRCFPRHTKFHESFFALNNFARSWERNLFLETCPAQSSLNLSGVAWLRLQVHILSPPPGGIVAGYVHPKSAPGQAKLLV